MDFFNIIIATTPVVIFVWAIGWMEKYYKRHQSYMRYRSWKACMPVYLTMAGMAVAAILVALPFIVLFMFRPL